MATLQHQSMPRERFLLMSANLLHRAFFEANRTDAKNLYRSLADGLSVPLTRVQMEDRSILGVNLSLDHREYRGKLNFSAFRSSVGVLVANLGQALQEARDYPTFGDEGESGQVIFGITAVTMEDEQPNVMVLGTRANNTDASVTLQLMYLDPAQFVAAT